MSKKIFYRLNPATDKYERVYPSRRQKIWITTRHIFEAVAIAAALALGAYTLIDLPKEKILREKNRALEEQIQILDDRFDDAIKIMNRLAERDNNLYRAIMQIDPLTPASRYAGIDNTPDSVLYNVLSDKQLVNSVTAKINLLERQVVAQSMSFDQIANAIANNKDRLAHIPSIQPVSERDMTRMASGYGWRKDPVYGSTKHHDGMDFSSPTGTPVYATGDGTVAAAGWNGAYGNSIDISHGYNYTTRYAHLSEVLVKPGQKVSRGDLIGKVGSTGKSTGPHLHYEVRFKDIPQNPVNYYFQDLTPEQYALMVEEAENAGHVMD